MILLFSMLLEFVTSYLKRKKKIMQVSDYIFSLSLWEIIQLLRPHVGFPVTEKGVQVSGLPYPHLQASSLKPFRPASNHPIFEVWWRIWTQLLSSIAHLMFNNAHCHQSKKILLEEGRWPSLMIQCLGAHGGVTFLSQWGLSLKKRAGFLLMMRFSWPFSPQVPEKKIMSLGRSCMVMWNLWTLGKEKISQWQ